MEDPGKIDTKNRGRADTKDRGRENVEKGVRSDIVVKDLIAKILVVEVIDKVDAKNRSRKDVEKDARPGIIAKDLVVEEKQKLVRQIATAFSLLSFQSVFFLFFSSSKSNTYSCFEGSSLVLVAIFVL